MTAAKKLCNFFDSIQIPIALPTPLHSNNQSTINLITTGNVNEHSQCYESPKKETIFGALEPSIHNLKLHNGVKI